MRRSRCSRRTRRGSRSLSSLGPLARVRDRRRCSSASILALGVRHGSADRARHRRGGASRVRPERRRAARLRHPRPPALRRPRARMAGALLGGAPLRLRPAARERAVLAAGFVALALVPRLLAWITAANIEQRSPLFVAAIDLAERREDASAEDGLRQAAAVFPEDSDVWYLLGIYAERSGDLERAQSDYGRAMQADPAGLPAHPEPGQRALHRGRLRRSDPRLHRGRAGAPRGPPRSSTTCRSPGARPTTSTGRPRRCGRRARSRRPRSTSGPATRRSRASSRPATPSSGRARAWPAGTPSRRAAACPATAAPAAGGSSCRRGRWRPLGAARARRLLRGDLAAAGRRGGVRPVRPRLLRPLPAAGAIRRRTARSARGSPGKEDVDIEDQVAQTRADAAPRRAEAPASGRLASLVLPGLARRSIRAVRCAGAAIAPRLLLRPRRGDRGRPGLRSASRCRRRIRCARRRSRARRSRLSSGCAPSGARGACPVGLEGTLQGLLADRHLPDARPAAEDRRAERRGRGRHDHDLVPRRPGRRRRVDRRAGSTTGSATSCIRAGYVHAGAARPRPRGAAGDAASAWASCSCAKGLDRPAGAARGPPPPDRADRLHGVSLARRPLPIQPGRHGRLRRGPHGARVDRLDPHGSRADGRRVAALREEGRLARRRCSGARRASRACALVSGEKNLPRGRSRCRARRRRPGAGSTAGSPSATSWSARSSRTSRSSRAPPTCSGGI